MKIIWNGCFSAPTRSHFKFLLPALLCLQPAEPEGPFSKTGRHCILVFTHVPSKIILYTTLGMSKNLGHRPGLVHSSVLTSMRPIFLWLLLSDKEHELLSD